MENLHWRQSYWHNHTLGVAQSWSVLQGLASEQAHIFTPRASSPVSLDDADFEMIPAKLLLLVASRLGEYGGQDFCIFPVFHTLSRSSGLLTCSSSWSWSPPPSWPWLLTCLLDAGEDRSALPHLHPHLAFYDPTSLTEYSNIRIFKYLQTQILVLNKSVWW